MDTFEKRMRDIIHTSDLYDEDDYQGVDHRFCDLARKADVALAAKDAEIARLLPRKIAPVQGYYPGIPWDMHLRAYAAYCKKWSPQKALVEGNCRGGFGTEELDEFIPGWLDELSERKRLTDLNTAKGELIEWYANHVVGAFGSKGIQKHNELRARIRSLEDDL